MSESPGPPKKKRAPPPRPLTEGEQGLVAANDRLVQEEVNAALRKAPWADREDLYQAGVEGLMSAIVSRTRDPRAPFEPYARIAVRNAIRNSESYTRGAKRRNLAITLAAQNRLIERGVVGPTVEDIARETANGGGEPLTAAQVKAALQDLALAGSESLEALAEEGREVTPSLAPASSRPLAPRDWTEMWMRVLVEMARASSLGHDDTYLLACDVLGMENADIARKLGIKEGALRTRKTRLYDQLLEWLSLELSGAGADPADAGVLLGHLRHVPGKPVSAEQQARRLASLATLLRSRVAVGSSPRWLLELVQMVLVFVEEAGSA